MTQGRFLNYGDGAFYGTINGNNNFPTDVPNPGGYYDGNNAWVFNASRSSSIYGKANHVIPLNRKTLFVIKY